MPRPEKVQAVADIKERLESAQAVFLAEYAGLSVTEQQQLRRALRSTEGQFKVVKMTLARLAAEELGHTDLTEMLSGPTGLTFADQDAAATAKALQDFAKDHDALTIKGALLSGEVISPEKVSELASLPSRDVLLSQIAGAFEAPMVKLASLVGALPRDLATMVQQLIEKLPDDTPAEEPAPAAEEAPAEEAAAEEAEAAPAEEAPAEEAAAEPTEEAEAAPAEEAAAEESDEAPAEAAEEPAEEPEPAEESEEAPAEEAKAEEAPAAADESNDENDKADEAEEEETNG